MSKTTLDQARLEYLFTAYYKSLCLVSYNYVKDMDAAKDIVQDFFIKCWEKFHGQELPDKFEGYAYIAVKNKSLNYIESQQVKLRREQQLLHMQDSEEFQQGVSQKEQLEGYQEQLVKVISQLPEQRRKVFMLSAVNGRKYSEIAAEMNISVNTVKTQIRKAYLFIRKNCNVSLLLLAGFFKLGFLNNHPFSTHYCL